MTELNPIYPINAQKSELQLKKCVTFLFTRNGNINLRHNFHLF